VLWTLAIPWPAAARGPLAADGYAAAYSGESTFASVGPGTTGRLTVIYTNVGSRPWLLGTVGLLVCAEDKVTCGVPSPNAAYASHWYSPTVYAAIASTVEPGENAFFSYEIAVPAGTLPDATVKFHGAVGFIETGAVIALDGYYQSNTTPAAAATHWLRATFVKDPIPADGRTSTTLQVDVLGPASEVNASDDQTVVVISEVAASLSFCQIQTPQATVRHGHAEFDIVSAESPGRCEIVVSDDRGASAVATLTTQLAGSPVRLTVSGNNSPKVVGGGVVILAVDIDDVNVNLVQDSTRAVTMTLDPATCAGAPGGVVYIASGDVASAVDGRAWFSLRSNGAYRGCRATVTSPGLRSSVATVSFLAGPPRQLSCAFSPAAIDPDGFSSASVELRDVFGNVVTSLGQSVTFVRASGEATAPIGEPVLLIGSSAMLLAVQAGHAPGTDVYTAILGETAESTCAIAVRPLGN
jgi:hypothetical protein